MKSGAFQKILWDYYHAHSRSLPWRMAETDGSFDPYKILVSELMLQQTQVARVIPKYTEFLERFPTVQTLAQAPLAAVLKVWSGLGYNRRAKFLHQAAQKIMQDFSGVFPKNLQDLITLPGVGANTAGAIMAYAFNAPITFIETNIRTVYIHHFFDDAETVSDKQLQPLLHKTIDRNNPREFYWALMDYGSHLKNTIGNLSQKSKHYTKQSKFHGSLRQIRGRVLKLLIVQPLSLHSLMQTIEDERLPQVLDNLEAEQLICQQNKLYCLGAYSYNK